MKKIKKLCGIKKSEFEELKDEITKIVKTPNFICKKCLKVSIDKKHLCKGESF